VWFGLMASAIGVGKDMQYNLLRTDHNDHDDHERHEDLLYDAESGHIVSQSVRHRCGSDGLAMRMLLFCKECSGIDTSTREGSKCVDVESMDPVEKGKLMWTFGEVAIASNFCFFFNNVIHNKFCDFLFKCGCTWNWDGGWDDCNYHKQGVPRCPWCLARATAWTTTLLPCLLMFAAYIYMLYNRRRRCDYIGVRYMAAIATYFITGTIVGFIFFIFNYHYKDFLMFSW
jgi:hypothetical protein